MTTFQGPTVAWHGDRDAGGPLVVLLHGRGSNEADIMALADHLPDGLDHAAVRAPIAEGGGYAWFANRGIGRPVVESLADTMAWFRTWLDEIAPDGRPVVLAGFSGGAASPATCSSAPGPTSTTTPATPPRRSATPAATASAPPPSASSAAGSQRSPTRRGANRDQPRPLRGHLRTRHLRRRDRTGPGGQIGATLNQRGRPCTLTAERGAPRPTSRLRRRGLLPRPRAAAVRIAKDNPLPDGNKRLAWQSLTIFLALNGYALEGQRDAEGTESSYARP